MSGPNDTSETDLCVVCCKDIDIVSVGTCDHPVCFECSTRMRVLCDQKECPICRGLMPKVIFSEEIDTFQSLFRRYQRADLQDRKHGLIFASVDIQKRYQELLEYRCTTCNESNHKAVFSSFHELRDHVRRKHDLLFCELCVRNLKIFCFERRCYTRQELGRHRRKGDPDNTSHRGHPLCEFCDTRFVDSDELFRHLRRDHLFCHFCDADGKHQYYNTLPDLIEHFKDEHFLCEEGDCRNMPLAAVFRTDIDLKAHIATEHGKFLSKQGAKQARTLEVEFTLAPRPRPDRNKRQVLPTPDWADEGAVGYDSEPTAPVQPTPLTLQDFPALGNSSGSLTVQSRPLSAINYTQRVNSSLREADFPTLGGSRSTGVSISTNSSSTRKPDVTITRTVGSARPASATTKIAKNSENFPRLGAPSTSTVHVSLNNNGQTSTPKVSIHVSHNSMSGVTSTQITTSPSVGTSSGDFNIHQKPVEAFPALGGSMNPLQPQWVQKQKPKKQESRLAKVAPPPQLPPSDLSQFPTLSKPKSDKKEKKSAPTTTTSNINNNNNISKPSKSDVSEISEGIKLLNKSKSKKKKNLNNNSAEHVELTENKNNMNGMVKKRSELKIGSLSQVESKAPPGFTSKPPPPGFSSQNFPKLTNDLTFTNSSGQSYTINPSHYHQPRNFTQRNQNLIKRFMDALDNEMIKEFKSYSALFREGNLPAARYYEHCKSVLGSYFEEVFPELLVLLPDIEKQQELFAEYSGEGKSRLLVCENCKQVIFKRELTEHYNLHSLDSHFPTLSLGADGAAATNNSNAWKK